MKKETKKQATLVFIDDSEDTGFKLNKGSSKFFVIAAVIFSDTLEAEKTALAIKELKRTLRLPDVIEFKFNKSNRKVREVFLRTISTFDFKIRCLVVDKTIIRSDELKNKPESFYSYMIKMLLQYSGKSILDAKIKIDGSGNRLFRRNFLLYLRKQLNSDDHTVIRNCKLVDSRNNMIIQMTDMIAGSIRRSYDKNRLDNTIYKKIIAKHIEDEWGFK